MKKSPNKGIYYALATALISGVSIFLNKYAVDAVKPPLYFTAIKNLSVGFLIAAGILSTGKWKELKTLKKKELLYLLSVGVIGGSIPFYLYFTGLSQIPAINGALIHKTLVFWVAIMALPFLKERMPKAQILGVFLLFAGNVTIGGFKGFQFSKGELLVVSATILWAGENILAKKVLSFVPSDIVTLFRMGLGSLILVMASLLAIPNTVSKTLTLEPTQILWVLITAVLLLGYVLSWYKALALAPATTVASVLVSSTLVTNVLSAVFVTHTWNIALTAKELLMLVGVAIIVLAEKRRNLQIAVN
ncbi:MAG: DMT family transporter [Patescibacteria group bacterium]